MATTSKVIIQDEAGNTYNPKTTSDAVQHSTGTVSDAIATLTGHTGNKSNPHGVTAAQVGADPKGSAAAVNTTLASHSGDKVLHLTAAERTAWNGKADNTALTSHTGNTTIHITAAERTAWNGKAAATTLTSHTGNKSNPHAVTAAQVGADPTGTAAKVEALLNAHIGNKSNPHGVTTSQVGTEPGGTIVSATAPTNTRVLWMDTTTKLLKYYDGSKWVASVGAYS